MAFVGGKRREVDLKTHKKEDCFITSRTCQTKSYTRQMTNFHAVIVHRWLHCAFTKNINFSLSIQPDLQSIEFLLLRTQKHFLEVYSGIINLTCQETIGLAELQSIVVLQTN